MNRSTANERQVGGLHYKAPLQHWDVVTSASADYFVGQITKYLARWRKKNGLQDLEKAEHYAEKLQELINSGRWAPEPLTAMGELDVLKFCCFGDYDKEDRLLIYRAFKIRNERDVNTFLEELRVLKVRASAELPTHVTGVERFRVPGPDHQPETPGR